MSVKTGQVHQPTELARIGTVGVRSPPTSAGEAGDYGALAD